MKLARRVAQLSSSPTLAITSKANQLKASGVDVVSFGAGEPDFDTPEFIKQAAVEALKKGQTKYTPSSGLPLLKNAIAKKFQQDNGLTYQPDQIVVSAGAKHSLYNIIQVICDQGDEVIIPAPYWVSYPEMVQVAEGVPVIVATAETNLFKMTAKQFEAAITQKTKVLVLNSPSNPTGCVYTRPELEAIAEVAVKHQIAVISDEIYEKLLYDGVQHISIAGLNSKIYDLTFTVNGMSKAYAMTGWRIGYLGGPKEAVSKISNLQDHSTSNPNSIAQMASIAALGGDQSFINDMRKEFDKRRLYMYERFARMKNITAVKPQGAFYMFCNISPTGLSGTDIAKRLLDDVQVAVIPGSGFGDDRYIRLSFATSLEQITKGLDRIEQWLNKLP